MAINKTIWGMAGKNPIRITRFTRIPTFRQKLSAFRRDAVVLSVSFQNITSGTRFAFRELAYRWKRTTASPGGNKMNTNVETLTQIDAMVIPGLPLSASAETGLTGTKPRDFGLRWNVAKAFHCSREAQREERNGFNYTAAMKWRSAAELFAPDTRAVEYCWCEWERIMQLPRRLAGPAFAAPTIVRVM
jgi:hypothetical protein